MLYSGLCSVTFRKMTAVQIIELAAKAGLKGIEWGGDVHVPHGKVDIAQQVKDLTTAAGLEIPSYGSYYKVAESEKTGLAFSAVADSAAMLGAKTIRVWAGGKHSKDADAAYRQSVEEDSRRIAGIAGQRGMTVSYEFHGGTLTDTPESTVALLTAVEAAGLKTYWQPALKITHNQRVKSLKAVRPWLTHLHVYYFSHEQGAEQVPLEQGQGHWMEYLHVAKAAEGDRYCMLEFVPDSTAESLLRDAGTLNTWLKQINKEE